MKKIITAAFITASLVSTTPLLATDKAKTSAAKAKPAEPKKIDFDEKEWGIYASLAGKRIVHISEATRSWHQVEDKIIERFEAGKLEEIYYFFDKDGKFTRQFNDQTWHGTVEPDGSVLWLNTQQTEKNRNNNWHVSVVDGKWASRMVRTTKGAPSWRGHLQRYAVIDQATSTSQNHQLSTAISSQPPRLHANTADKSIWGDLSKIAGKIYHDGHSFFYTVGYEKRNWADSYYIKTNYLHEGKINLKSNYIISFDAKSQSLTGIDEAWNEKIKVFANPDGSIMVRWKGIWHRYRALPNGNLEEVVGEYDNNKGFTKTYGTNTLTATSSREFTQKFEQEKTRWAKVQAERPAPTQAAPKNSGGGMLGTLIGAAVGATASAAGGLNTKQTIGVIAKAASVTSSNRNTAAALSGLSSGVLPSSTSSQSSASSGSQVRTTFATKPNLAAGTCSGFTESNYRQRALQGGGDSQLWTMCGQAFEYYVMYKRAIAQGYSEADANRTYSAHEQSADVAAGYLASHGS